MKWSSKIAKGAFIGLLTFASSTNAHYFQGYDAMSLPDCNAMCFEDQYTDSLKDWNITIEGLYWKACEDGIAYGTQTEIDEIVVDQPVTIHSKIKTPHFDWDWGFRLGGEYELPCDCWGIALYWTHFQSRAHARHRDVPEPGVSFFTPGWGATSFNGLGTNAIADTNAHLKLHVDIFDVQLGRHYCLSPCLTIRPHLGIRAAWINQKYRIHNFSVNEAGERTLVQNVRLRSDFEGVGLHGGVDTLWDLGCGFGLYGSAGVSGLYGRFDNNSSDFYTFFTGTTTEFNVHQKDHFCGCRAFTDAALGLSWKTSFCNDSIAVVFRLGWEHHLFINQNEFEDFVQLNADPSVVVGENKNVQFHRGDLCLQGLTFGAKIEF